MLHLKLASVNDLPIVIDMIYKLYRDSAYASIIEWDYKSVKDTLESILKGGPNAGAIVVLYSDENPVGVIVCSSTHLHFNTRHKMATELAFWTDPAHRNASAFRKLIGAYKYWARINGCHSILMGKLKNNNEVETYTIRKL